jgi:hypothetical protein
MSSQLHDATRTPNQNTQPMKTIIINKIALTVELAPAARDSDTNAGWRNGIVTLPDGMTVDCGGGWIETDESAELANESAGIASGIRQGVFYPNETTAGQFTPYEIGEDESGWQNHIMPAIYGDDWEEREDADDELEDVYAKIQADLAELA